MALYPTEVAVLDRHDRGETIDQITRATGFRRETVSNIIQRFHVNLAQDAKVGSAIRTRTMQLGERVRAAGGHR